MQFFDIHHSIIQERLIAQNALAFCFLTNIPIVPGHALICPIRIIACSEELTIEEWQAIHALKQQVCLTLKQKLGAEGFNFAWNMGTHAGQSVPHFHLHVVPRKPGDTGILTYEPRVFLYRPGSREISPSEELKATAEFLRG